MAVAEIHVHRSGVAQYVMGGVGTAMGKNTGFPVGKGEDSGKEHYGKDSQFFGHNVNIGTMYLPVVDTLIDARALKTGATAQGTSLAREIVRGLG